MSGFALSALFLSWIAILLLAFAMSGLTRQIHELRKRAFPERRGVGLEPGSAAPQDMRLIAEAVRPAALLFADSNCESCRTIVPEFASWATHQPGVSSAVILPDSRQQLSLDGVRVIEDASDLFGKFRITATPFLVIVSREGTVEYSVPIGSSQILLTTLGNLNELEEAHG